MPASDRGSRCPTSVRRASEENASSTVRASTLIASRLIRKERVCGSRDGSARNALRFSFGGRVHARDDTTARKARGAAFSHQAGAG